MEKSARHLSTGEKITQAADDGSAYAISERMRAMIRGLRQANDNAKTATDLLKTAEDALHGTTGLLRRMKELAVQAANGIYSDADYRAMDDEYQQCKSQLDDIAALTNYNGIPLLDGSWESRGGGQCKTVAHRSADRVGRLHANRQYDYNNGRRRIYDTEQYRTWHDYRSKITKRADQPGVGAGSAKRQHTMRRGDESFYRRFEYQGR